jgi:hypothetical protein
LVVEPAIVGGDIVGVEKEALLYCRKVRILLYCISLVSNGNGCDIHLLKLVTGVDTSTRPARRLGRPGKTVNSRSRSAAAAPYSRTSCESTGIFVVLWGRTRHE